MAQRLNSSSYAHQTYVQDEKPSTALDQLHTLKAAQVINNVLSQHLPSTVRWAYRGFVAYRCHVPDRDLYGRFTDDVDIAVDSDDFSTIDEIEDTLLLHEPTQFLKCLSPSKLLKVHFITDDGAKVRLDIYNMIMHNTGGGYYRNCTIQTVEQPRQFEDCPAFNCPVLPYTTLVDLKLVAYLERGQEKDLADVFFILWTLELDREAGLSWYASQSPKHALGITSIILGYATQYRAKHHLQDTPSCFDCNLGFIATLSSAKYAKS